MQVSTQLESKSNVRKPIQKPTHPPQADLVYGVNNRLSILVEESYKTHRIDEWLTLDPLSLAKVKHQYKFELEPHLNRILFERLRRVPNEDKKFLGLDLVINFPGYSETVPASMPYNRYPVKFYQWWIENQESISLTFKERLNLLDKVHMIDKSALLPKHKALMNR